jgi:hypothetical protein
MKKLFLCAVLSVLAMMPLAVSAQDHRFYDRGHHDYHEWNDHEDRAWHMYWEQRHRHFIEWNTASEAERQRYWEWRHRHSDALLHIDIR